MDNGITRIHDTGAINARIAIDALNENSTTSEIIAALKKVADALTDIRAVEKVLHAHLDDKTPHPRR